MLVTLLRFALIQATAVGTADQALSRIQSERFDLYLTDARLPKIDGFELCRRIRNFDLSTPIIFFSGSAYAADKRKGIEAGANGYVIKPDIEDLLRTIKQFVSFAEGPIAPEITSHREGYVPRLSTLSLREPLYVG
jgi:CheY-like chemotaxis protein